MRRDILFWFNKLPRRLRPSKTGLEPKADKGNKVSSKGSFNKPFSNTNVFQKTEVGDPTEKNSKAQKIQNMGISVRHGRQQKAET